MRRPRKAAIRRLTPEGESNPIDGYVDHPARQKALELLEQTLDDLTDAEYLGLGTDEGWWYSLCLDSLHRLPSEVEPALTAREYELLKARAVVQTAYAKLADAQRESQRRAARA